MIGATLFLVTIFCSSTISRNISDSKVLQNLIEHKFELFRQRNHIASLAQFNYVSNVTETNGKLKDDIFLQNSIKDKEMVMFFKSLDLSQIENELLKRQLNLSMNIGDSVLNEEDYKDLRTTITAMSTNYAAAKVCSFRNPSNCTLQLEPDIENIFTKSRDPTELLWYWRQWYDKAGAPVRHHFSKYVKLTTKAANLNNFKSRAEYWLDFYEDPNFENSIDKSYEDIMPLYSELHGYVRYRLNQYYGNDIVPAMGDIPMHLLGNVWAQAWSGIIDLVQPYPNKLDDNLTLEMQRQGYTVHRLVKLADTFFQSLGFEPLPEKFWNYSLFTRPTDRQVSCHAGASDLFEDDDVRIHMCMEVNEHYFNIIHHELGHVQNYLQFRHQPMPFRDTPNNGFTEAIGDSLQLAVTTPKHLKLIGLSPISTFNDESRINNLFAKALSKVVILPFVYALEKYRYAVFRGDIPEGNWNTEFWHLRSILAGVAPPINRTEANFDPPAKYHISSDVEYMRYFASHIFQFQFYKSLCLMANEYVPNDPERSLDNCDFYGNKKAGLALRKFLSLGASKHWKQALQEFTGENELNSAAFLEYFEPLYKWLKKENTRLKVPVGWIN